MLDSANPSAKHLFMRDVWWEEYVGGKWRNIKMSHQAKCSTRAMFFFFFL